jgi:3-hydroxybutyrate dehydrogenase
MTLKTRTALVTGSTSGIGLAIARAFAAEGANIVLNGFGKPEEIEQARTTIETEFGVRALYSGADMSKSDEIGAMVRDAQECFGSVDVLVNNAGIQFVSPIEEFPAEKWEQIIAINLSSALHGLGADHQHRLGALAGGLPVQVGLRRRQARHRRSDQDGRAGTRAP